MLGSAGSEHMPESEFVTIDQLIVSDPTYIRSDFVPANYRITTPLSECRKTSGARNLRLVARLRWPFTINASVLLPDQLHVIWSLLPDDE